MNYLFRVITVGGRAVGQAKLVFDAIHEHLSGNSGWAEIEQIFQANWLKDEEFVEGFKNFQISNAELAKYTLTKIHFNEHGFEQIPNHAVLHLEHIIPQDPARWVAAGFDFEDRDQDEVIENIGNLTLIDQALNESIQNSVFAIKVSSYERRRGSEERGTSIPMTYQIAEKVHADPAFTWSYTAVQERASAFSEIAKKVWCL